MTTCNHSQVPDTQCCNCRWKFKHPPRYRCQTCHQPICLVCEMRQPNPPDVKEHEPRP